MVSSTSLIGRITARSASIWTATSARSRATARRTCRSTFRGIEIEKAMGQRPKNAGRFLTMLSVVAALLFVGGFLFAQDKAQEATQFDKEHADVAAANPDKKVSDTTENVARQLPHLGTPAANVELVERTLLTRPF